MAHLAILSPNEMNNNFSDSFQSQDKIATLSNQIERLNHIIAQKDAALEEISQVFNNSKIQYTVYKGQQEQQIKMFQNSYKLDPKSNEELQRKPVTQKLDQIVSFLFSDLEKVLADSLTKDYAKQYFKLARTIKLPKQKQLCLQKVQENDTSFEGQQEKRIYQVPIEMQFLKEMIQADVQVNINPSKSFIYQVPLEMVQIDQIPIELGEINDEEEIVYLERKRYEIPIQINQVFEIMGNFNSFSEDDNLELSISNDTNKQIIQIPIEANIKDIQNKKMDSQIKQLLEKIKQLQFENERMKNQKTIVKMLQVPIQLQMEPKIIEIPIQVQIQKLIEVPIELQIQTKMENPIQIKMAPKIFEIPIELYLEPNEPVSQIKAQLELFNTSPQLEGFQPLNINSPPTSMIEQNKLPLGMDSDIKKMVQVDAQTDKMQQILPVRLKKTVSSIKYFELPLEVKTTACTIEKVTSFQEIKIQKKDKSETISTSCQTDEVNIQESLHTSIQTQQNNKWEQIIVKQPQIKYVEVISQKIVQKIVEVPVFYTIEVPILIDKILQIEKTIQIIKLVEVAIQVEIQRQILKQIPIQVQIEKQVIKYAEKESKSVDQILIKEVPIEVIFEKIIEVPTFIEKIKLIEVPIQIEVFKCIQDIQAIEKPQQKIFSKQIEIIKQIQVIKQVQKLKLIQVPVEVEVIKQVEIVKEVEVIKETQIIKIVELPVQVQVIKYIQVVKEIEVIKEIPIYIQKIKLMEIPMEVEVVNYNESIDDAIEISNDQKIQLKQRLNQIESLETTKKQQIIKQIKGVKEIQVIKEVIKEVQILKEVPIYLQKIKLVQVPIEIQVIKQIEVVKQIIREAPKIIKQIEMQIIQVPIEVVVQKIIYVPYVTIQQVPVEVEIEKIVIKEVPIEIQIEKIVVKQLPIEVLLQKQIIVEKQIEKIVQVFIPYIQEIPVDNYIPKIIEQKIPYIQEVPIQVQIIQQKIIYVTQTIEIPVLILIDVSNDQVQKKKLSQEKVQNDKYSLRARRISQEETIDRIDRETKQTSCKIFQLPIELEMQKTVQVEKIVEKIVNVQKIVQVEKILEIQKLVQRIKIVQIPVINQLEVQDEKIVPVIYEIPMEVQVQKIIYIEKPIQVIKQIQVFKQKIVQLPIQCVIEIPVYIQTIKQIEKIVFIDRLIQIPTELQMIRQEAKQKVLKKQLKLNRAVFSESIYLENIQSQKNNLKLKQINIQNQLKNGESSKIQFFNQQIQMIQLINQQIPATHSLSSIPRMYSMETVSVQSQSRKIGLNDYTFRQSMKFLQIQKNEQANIQIDFNSHVIKENDDAGSIQLNIVSTPLVILSNQFGIQTDEIEQEIKEQNITNHFKNIQNETSKKIAIFEIPIELQMVENEKKYLQNQQQNKQKMQVLCSKYDQQIKELHKTICMLQQITKENNQQKQYQKNRIQEIVYKLSYIQNQNESLKVLLSNAEEQIQNNQELNISKEKLINQLRKQILNTPKINTNLVIYELPIQMNMSIQTLSTSVQTEDIDLFANVQILQVPINMPASQQISQVDLLNIQAEEAEQFLRPILSFKDKSHNLNIKRIESIDFKSITSSRVSPMIYQIPIELYVQNEDESLILNDQQKELKVFSKDKKSEVESTRKQQINKNTTSIQVQTQKQLTDDLTSVQIQTEPIEQNTIKHIFQVPFEFNLIKQSQDIQVQLDQLKIVQNLDQELQNYKQNSLDKSHSNIDNQCLQNHIQNGQPIYENYSFKKESQPVSSKQTQSTQYFTSRIFEIPVQMKLISESELTQVISVTSQTETHKNYSIFQQFQLQQILSIIPQPKNRKLTIVAEVSGLSLNSSKYDSPPPREETLQNKIVSLGSQILLNVINNYSNVQSLTPGAMQGDSSSYDKFPQSNIQNISLIKKDSFNQDYKFMGSLNIRQELLSRQDPIHSVRLENNKLQGFQQPSSDQDHSGQMIIQHDEVDQKDLNRIHTPNLESHDLNFSQYVNMKQKFYKGEDDKQFYQENSQKLHEEITSLKKQIAQYQEEINKMEQQHQIERIEYEQTLQTKQQQQCLLKKEKDNLELLIQQYRIKINQSDEAKKRADKNIQVLLQNYEKIKQQLEKQEKSSNIQLERLRNIIDQKISEVKDAKEEDNHNKKNHQNQMNQIKQLVLVKNQLIEELEQQLQQKNDKLDHLQSSLEEMRKKVAMMRHDQQIDAASIYEQQFLRIKQTFLEQKRQLSDAIYQLRQENQKLKVQITTEINKSEQLYQTIQELSVQIENMRNENSQLHHLKSQLQNNYIQNVKQLNTQLQGMKGQIKGKDQTFYQSINSNKTIQYDVNSPKVKIQYLTPHNSQLVSEQHKYMEDYCKKLENLLLNYQKKIVADHYTIQQLQEKVCEYLKDALQKEQEAENLFLKLMDFENTINNLLVQKVTTQLQNRRLTKSIQQCEKRLKTLGNRLIERVREKAEYQSDQDDYLYE